MHKSLEGVSVTLCWTVPRLRQHHPGTAATVTGFPTTSCRTALDSIHAGGNLRLRQPIAASSRIRSAEIGVALLPARLGKPSWVFGIRDPLLDHSSPRMRGTLKNRGKQRQAKPVHPRVCGEHANCLDNASDCSGSSPRLRGTRRREPNLVVVTGSSPRLRGTLYRPGDRSGRQRFIPASAGKTLPKSYCKGTLI